MKKIYSLGILSSHPIQYYSPLYKTISEHPRIDLTVFYCHKQSKKDHAKSDFGIEFEWDIELLKGYKYKFLNNASKMQNVDKFFGCDNPEIYKIIKEGNFDAFIVQGWYLKSFWQAVIACWISGTKIFIRGDSQLRTNRNIFINIINYTMHRIIIQCFSAYLAVGKRSKRYFEYYGASNKKIFFTPHCVDNNYFEKEREKYKEFIPEIKRNHKIPLKSKVFLFVGKLIHKKRPFDFLNAIKLASDIDSEIVGIIVGEGHLRNQIESYIKENKINVIVKGFVNQRLIPQIYSISDYIVLPSDERETWGLVVNEAMASSICPIVSDKVGCSDDLVINGITGMTFKYREVNELANIIIECSKSEKNTLKMKCNAKDHIKNYSLNKTVEGIFKALVCT